MKMGLVLKDFKGLNRNNLHDECYQLNICLFQMTKHYIYIDRNNGGRRKAKIRISVYEAIGNY